MCEMYWLPCPFLEVLQMLLAQQIVVIFKTTGMLDVRVGYRPLLF